MSSSDAIADIHNTPSSARLYGMSLGGKDWYEVDRRFALESLPHFPGIVDIARDNRLFLYRLVRYLAAEAGIRQFLDMGCGLPTNSNVHQVAAEFGPGSRVAYVDNDPTVLSYGRALMAENDTTVFVPADFRDQDRILDDPGVRRLIDFSEPVAVLWLSVGHHLLDDMDPRGLLHRIMDDVAAPGSYLAFTQIVTDDAAIAAAMDEQANSSGMPWRTRSPGEVDALLAGLTPVEPGLVNIKQWRPDPAQPPLPPVPADLEQFLGASAHFPGYEYGGLLRKDA
ncbi:hypothetical protein DZF91_25955 [Actinomadura logoneensis]|uniref:SAM-dependent methyltransferase n=1 Tax=Actinomadura logoneensis TaxID=2293572 RepID=A0A372JHC3_9ACTN|nr:SAM-dependent methyltransferase [Actinomadura logoneensis]RFU38768.1 hypothetical protein DZF91_25955 [Actinomadura logoneensis]